MAKAKAKTPTKRKRGGQSKFDPALASQILERMTGGETINSICASLVPPIAPSTVRWSWCQSDKAFAARYAQAREMLYDHWADEVIDVSDDGTNDWMERKNSDGENTGWAINGEAVQRSRLRVDTRKWLLSKLRPAVYGDRLDVESKGTLTVKFVKQGD